MAGRSGPTENVGVETIVVINDILNVAFVPSRILAPLADALSGGVAPEALFGLTPEETVM